MDARTATQQETPLLRPEVATTKAIKRKPVGSGVNKSASHSCEEIGQLSSANQSWEDLDRPSVGRNCWHSLSGVDSWSWEAASAILSLVSITALVCFLRYLQDRPQASWTFRFTPNTVISLLSTTGRSSILVTISSVIGQDKWLWYGLGKEKDHPQSTRLVDLQTFDDASRGPLGSLPLIWLTRMRKHADFLSRLGSIAALLTLLSLDIDPFSQQILDITNRPATSANNLTVTSVVQRTEHYDDWFSTPRTTNDSIVLPALAMRAAIVNGLMTSPIENITLQCLTGNCQWPVIPTLAICSECMNMTGVLQKSNTSNSTQWTLPNGETSLSFSYMSITSKGYRDAVHYQDPLTPYLTIFDMITTTNPLNPTALECALFPCVQAYNISTENGKQTQKVSSTLATFIDNFPRNSTNERSTMATDTIAYQPVNHFLSPLPSKPNGERDAEYSISDTAVQAIATLLGTVFAGNPRDNSSSEGVQVLVQTNGDFQKVSDLMSNLALSMTNHIRLNPSLVSVNNDGNTTNPWHKPLYVGTAWSVESYFHNQDSEVRVWMGSLLPVLFFPLAEGVRGNFGVKSTIRQMQLYAENICNTSRRDILFDALKTDDPTAEKGRQPADAEITVIGSWSSVHNPTCLKWPSSCLPSSRFRTTRLFPSLYIDHNRPSIWGIGTSQDITARRLDTLKSIRDLLQLRWLRIIGQRTFRAHITICRNFRDVFRPALHSHRINPTEFSEEPLPTEHIYEGIGSHNGEFIKLEGGYEEYMIEDYASYILRLVEDMPLLRSFECPSVLRI
ncbi:uncharacterized protein PAC_03982 [Phialocephala subalpina]|uniref:Uncharacterized protein n=1 Tax=Phialocephala subalpina TaxID=576137 RepID=A0A1L7WMU7_9HELO|nr:uncharacterized protein PAC_03982 [Phialocephala subalpina]